MYLNLISSRIEDSFTQVVSRDSFQFKLAQLICAQASAEFLSTSLLDTSQIDSTDVREALEGSLFNFRRSFDGIPESKNQYSFRAILKLSKC